MSRTRSEGGKHAGSLKGNEHLRSGSSSWTACQLRLRPQLGRRGEYLARAEPPTPANSPRPAPGPSAGLVVPTASTSTCQNAHIAGGLVQTRSTRSSRVLLAACTGPGSPERCQAQDRAHCSTGHSERHVGSVGTPPPTGCQRQVRARCPSPSLGSPAGTSKAWPTMANGAFASGCTTLARYGEAACRDAHHRSVRVPLDLLATKTPECRRGLLLPRRPDRCLPWGEDMEIQPQLQVGYATSRIWASSRRTCRRFVAHRRRSGAPACGHPFVAIDRSVSRPAAEL